MLEVFKTRLHKASRNSEDSSVTWTQKKKGPLKDSEEWKKKKSRILSKMRALGKINLALIIARMPAAAMAAIYDMTRRVTMHHENEDSMLHLEDDDDSASATPVLLTAKTIEKLPDKVLQQIFSYLSPYQTIAAGRVCRRWRELTFGPALWQFVSFRANHGGIQVTNLDYFIHLIGTRFTELRVTELATDLITPNILHELAGRCPRLEHLTLDFSTAMQLHDFTDLQCFPSRLRGLTLCLGENIFLEGFLRKVYTFISSVEILHIIGTYEKVEDEEEEVFETVNVNKLKQYLPNLRVVNLWGVPFITDENVDQLSSNCAHLECLCVNYCTKVTGSSLQLALQRCKKLRSLFLAYTNLNNDFIHSIDWAKTRLEEVDIRGTDLNSETLIYLLTGLPHLVWLDASWLEHFTDQVLETWMQSGAMNNIQFLNLDTCDSLNETVLTELVTRHGHQLHALNLGGHHKLLEYFWMNMIPKLRNIKVLVMGVAEDCCPKVNAKIHIDQFVDCIAQNCPRLSRLEIRWDDETLRFSDKSSKFIDVLRMKCLKLHSMVLSDGQYYELVRSNFERADRMSVVRTTEMCRTGIIHCSKYYNHLLFN
uniref:F-box domain-containing protein n=2 Tax=Steinernema glaseri TaxID=37863 RepID=A0A1I7ZIX4_9BILA